MSLVSAGWLEYSSKASPLLFVPHPFFREVEHPKKLTVQLGSHVTDLAFGDKNTASTQKLLPARVFQNRDGKIQVGPFIAILTADGGNPFRGNHQNFIDLIEKGRKMGVTVFVLTPKGLKYGKKVVKGYLLHKVNGKATWRKTTLPYPDVIYNRVSSRIYENTPEMQQAFDWIEQQKIKFFNPRFFDKWTLTNYLTQDPTLSKLLPYTSMWKSPDDLIAALQKYPTLLLKPVNGKAGVGMIQIDRQGTEFTVVYQTQKKKTRFKFTNLNSLINSIQTLIQGKLYIIQQRIPLATYQGRPFDVRMLLQKNMRGEWGLTGAGVRVAGVNAISTHVPMGGRIERINKVLQTAFGTPHVSELKNRLATTGVNIAKYIEQKTGKLHGEMSMDIGIDENKNIWFFEANSKPMKFDEPEIRELSLRRLIQYSLFLSGYPEKLERKQLHGIAKHPTT